MPPMAISRRHSATDLSRLNIFFLPESGQNGVNLQPLFALLPVRFSSTLFDRVIFTLPPCFALHPARFDPALRLHPVQDRVEHSIRPLNLIIRTAFDLLDDRVTVAL